MGLYFTFKSKMAKKTVIQQYKGNTFDENQIYIPTTAVPSTYVDCTYCYPFFVYTDNILTQWIVLTKF